MTQQLKLLKLCKLLENDIDISDALDLIEYSNLLFKLVPDTNIHEPIIGPKYKPFLDLFNSSTLPFTNFNLRSGIYCSFAGIIAEYISLKVILDQFKNGILLNDKQNQLNGNDIQYYHNDNLITADIKSINNDLYAHKDWFKKSSTRFHLVNLKTNKHYIIGRSYLEKLHQLKGNNIDLTFAKKYGTITTTDINYITGLL